MNYKENNKDGKSRVCCINLIGKDQRILNKTFTPMLFYWDGESDIEQDIVADLGFMNFLRSTAFKLEHYGHAIIAWTEYDFNEYDKLSDHVSLKSKNIQNMFECNEYKDISLSLIYEMIYNMYMKAFNNERVPDDSKSYDEQIKSMLFDMFNHYGDKLTIKSIINYVRSQAKDNNISQENIQELIKTLNTFVQ